MLEMVCTDTPLNFASRVWLMSSVFRRSAIAFPISGLFIGMNNSPFSVAAQAENGEFVHHDENHAIRLPAPPLSAILVGNHCGGVSPSAPL
jgi:hypothetical protein